MINIFSQRFYLAYHQSQQIHSLPCKCYRRKLLPRNLFSISRNKASIVKKILRICLIIIERRSLQINYNTRNFIYSLAVCHLANSYDRNTRNATFIHPGEAERPLHRKAYRTEIYISA